MEQHNLPPQHELKPVSLTQARKERNSKASVLRSIIPMFLDLAAGLNATGK